MTKRLNPRPKVFAAMIIPALALAGLAFGFHGGAGDIFHPQGRLLSQGRIFSFACLDFDQDGRLDIVVSDYLNPARILFGDSGREFAKAVPLTASVETATTGHGVALSDFNGDGRLDLFLVYNEYASRILFGDGKGGFADSGRAIGPPGFNGTSVWAADFDGDRDIDVIVTYYRKGARLYLNDGAGTMVESDQAFPEAMDAGDIDGDGDADVLALDDKGLVSVWLNEKGRFVRQERAVNAGDGFMFVRMVDIDANGALDFLALSRAGNSVLWENDGKGGFRKNAQAFSSGTRLAAGDIDRDGRTDLVIGSSVWLNKGGGTFENVQTVALGMAASLDLADIDGDGDLDLLGAGLVRETGRADLLLFENILPKR